MARGARRLSGKKVTETQPTEKQSQIRETGILKPQREVKSESTGLAKRVCQPKKEKTTEPPYGTWEGRPNSYAKGGQKDGSGKGGPPTARREG